MCFELLSILLMPAVCFSSQHSSTCRPLPSLLHWSTTSFSSFSPLNCGFSLILLVKKQAPKGFCLLSLRKECRSLTFLSGGTEKGRVRKSSLSSCRKMTTKFSCCSTDMVIIFKHAMYMQNEYNKLGWEFKKFYIIRMFLTFAVLTPVALYINSFFSDPETEYPTHQQVTSHEALASVISTTSQMLVAVARTTDFALGRNASRTNHCLSNMSSAECEQYLYSEEARKVTAKYYGTSVGIRCLEGDCSRVGALVDYYSSFRLTMHYVRFMTVSYGTNKLIAPALESEVTGLNANVGTQWGLEHIGQDLVLSRYFQMLNGNITVRVCINETKLAQEYQISMEGLSFSVLPGSNSGLSVYTLDSTSLFSSVPVPSTTTTFSDLSFKLIALCILAAILPLMVYFIYAYINDWKKETFRHISTLDSLYKYQLNTVFQGKNPKNTVIITRSAFSSFYEELSQLIDEDYQQLLAKQIEPEKEESFRFLGLIGRVRGKFMQERRPLEEERSREVSNLKHMMKSAINEISESSSKKLREMFGRARELHLAKAFFHFGYLSLMLPCSDFDKHMGETTMPLPSPISSFLRHINRTVHSADIKFAFKFAFAFHPAIEQQLIMKLHFNLLHRYFTTLRELDFGLGFGKQLGMEREIRYLQETIDNNKYIFMTYLK